MHDPMIAVEGYRPAELLSSSPSIRIRSAEILASLRRTPEAMTVELAHIHGRGEGVLLTLHRTALLVGRRLGASTIDYIVHAVNCRYPNTRLQSFLENNEFVKQDVPDIGIAYFHRIRLTA